MEDATDFAELLTNGSDEPLHPDLQECLCLGGPFPMLSHPLMHVPYFSPIENKMMNKMYAQKLKAKEEFLASKKWDRLLYLIERPYRFDAFSEYQDQMSDKEYWSNLAWVYYDSENIHEFDFIPELLLSDRPGREHMMTESGQQTLAEMPETVTVYKGFNSSCAWDGDFSFTTEKKVARWFAKRFGIPGPKILIGTILKSDILAYLDGRGEFEILAQPEKVTVTTIRHLKRDPSKATTGGEIFKLLNN